MHRLTDMFFCYPRNTKNVFQDFIHAQSRPQSDSSNGEFATNRKAFFRLPQGFIAVALLLATGCAPPAAGDRDQNDSTRTSQQQPTEPIETWDAVYKGEAKIGYIHTKIEPDPDQPESLLHLVSEMVLKVPRFDQTLEMRMRIESTETRDGEVRSFTSRTTAGPTPIVVEGVVRDGRLKLVTHSRGNRVPRELPWVDSNRGFLAVEQTLERKPMKPGEHRQLLSLWPGFTGAQIVRIDLDAEQDEEVAVLDGTRKLLKIKSTAHIGDQTLDTVYWTDPKGQTIKSHIPASDQTVYRTSRQNALAEGKNDAFDFGWSSIVHVATPLPSPQKTKQVRYRATLPKQDPSEVFPSSIGQKVTRVSEHTADLVVQAVRPDIPKEVPPVGKPTEADLSPNSLIQSDDPDVKKMAEQVAAKQKDPWPVAVALEQHVYTVIRAKNFEQGFATAADVARTLEGDCTEHAVLLAALCRARKIPARVVFGLVYSSAEQGFAFHMWNVVWITDRWVPLDATLGRGGIGAAHISLGQSDLAAENVEPAMLRVLQVLGKLKLQIVQVDGQPAK